MADENDSPVAVADDEDEKAIQPPPEGENVPSDADAKRGTSPAIGPMPQPAIHEAFSSAAPTEAPSIVSPQPQFDASQLTGPPAGPPAPSLGQIAQEKLSPVAQQNPFALLMAKEANIHNPFLRILAKVGTGVGAGAEGLSKDYPAIEAQRIAAAGQPSEVALRGAQTAEAQAAASQAPSEIAAREADTALKRNPKPELLQGDVQKSPDGTIYQGYKMADGSVKYFPQGQPPVQAPAGGATEPPERQTSAAGPAGPPAPVAGPQPPQVAASGLPAGSQKYQAPPQATPEEAAKLAPVGPEAETYNKQIKDLAGAKAADFLVKPTDSREQAEKQLAAAKNQAESGRQAEATSRANAKEDISPVQARDPATGRVEITNLGDATKRKLEDVLPVSSTEIATARATLTNVNLMEQALGNLKENLPDFDKLNQNDRDVLQEFLNSREMNPPGGALGYISGAVNSAATSFLQSGKAQSLSGPARNILQSIVNMRESSLGLGKLETGGSRAMQSAIDAINKTLPGTFITNAADAEKQLGMFADRLDEIKADAPVLKGQSFRDNPFKTPMFASAPGKPRLMSTDGGKTWQPAK